MVMKSMSIDLMDEGIGVLLLHPGHVQTEMGGPEAVLTVTQSVHGKLVFIAKFVTRCQSTSRVTGKPFPQLT